MLTKEQNELFDFMSELCQKALNKKWYYEWEFFLWRALVNDFKSIEKFDFNDEVKSKLNLLISKCNGWIEIRKGEKVFIELDKWKLEVKRKNVIEILLPICCAVFSFFIFFVYYHIKENTYYFIYPKLTLALTWLSSSLYLGGFIFFVSRYYKRKEILKKSFAKLLKFTILIIIFLSLVIGSLQYLIYLYNKDSFIVDKDLLDYEIKSEIHKIELIQNNYKKKKYFCNYLSTKIGYKGYQHFKFVQEYNFGIIKSSAQAYCTYLGNNRIYLRSDFQHIEPPPPGEELTERDFTRLLIISNDTINIEIFKSEETLKYFINFFDKPDSLSNADLKQIITSYIIETESKILQLDNNIVLIKKRGLPLSVFTFNTFMKSINNDQNYYKSFSWLSRLLILIHVIIILYFIGPLLNFGIKIIWKKKEVRNQ